jgi:ketosteroid isomerase-like protein
MSDREEIIETVNRYCWALDLKDCGRLADVFTPDVTADYDGLDWTDLDSMIADMTAWHDQRGDTQHLIGSHLISVDGDEATCRSYAHVVLTRRIDGEWAQFSMGARYADRLRRVPGGWRVYHREARAMWRAGDRRVVRD